MDNTKSIAFASGKGGTGKTTLAVNFAKHLSMEKNIKVALYDLDVEEPNSLIYFPDADNIFQTILSVDIPSFDLSKCRFCGICDSKCNFNAISVFNNKLIFHKELCKSCQRCKYICPAGAISFEDMKIGKATIFEDRELTIFEGRLNEGKIQAKDLIRQVKNVSHHKTFDYKILDCPPGTTCPMVESVTNADFVILVTEPTPFGLHDLSLAVEALAELKKRFAVIINKSDENDVIIYDYCSAKYIDIITTIKFDINYAKISSSGRLLASDESGNADNYFSDKMSSISAYLSEADV